MDYEFVRHELDQDAAVITLNRPQRRNALSLELMLELIYVLGEVGRDKKIRSVILAAEGTVFCSGHDLTEMVDRKETDYRRLFDTCCALMQKIQSIPQPVIAQVQGVATAAGCQLVASCDLAVASDTAQFATPGVRIGLFCTTPMVALTRAIGRKRAMEMLLTGKMINAATAADWGLINRAVPEAELELSTRRLAAQIAEASNYTVALGKKMFYEQIEIPQRLAYEQAKEVMTQNSMAEDATEGISAFLGKRVPVWKGR
ncbi:MAG: enoyl-CoA hydratase [Bryobacteraceae bacterium]